MALVTLLSALIVGLLVLGLGIVKPFGEKLSPAAVQEASRSSSGDAEFQALVLRQSEAFAYRAII